MDYRTHQRRLLPALAKTYALSFAQQRLVDELHEVFTDDDADDRSRRELETLAAGVKAVATWHASETIQSCREACGGAGYLRTSRFAALKADTDVFTTFEGDNTVLLQLAAKNLLTDYKDAFGELDPLGMAQFVAGQALGVLTERTRAAQARRLAAPGRDDDADLLARKTQLELFRWRHEHLLAGAARRLKGGIDAGPRPVRGARRLPGPRARGRALVGRPRRARVLPATTPARRRRCAASTRCTRSRPSAATTRSTAGCPAARSKAVDQGRQRALRRAAPGRARARRRVRRAGERARRRARRGRGAVRRVRTRLPRAERERQMLETARALFAARGYADVTMDEVAAAVGVTKPLLYNYYGNKEQLFLACMEPAADALRRVGRLGRRRRAADAPGALRAGIHAFFAFLDADGEAWRVLHDETLPAGGEIAARVAEYRARMEALVTASLQERTESRAVEPLSVAIFGAAEALGRWWLRTGELSAERTAELLIRTIEPGLRTR